MSRYTFLRPSMPIAFEFDGAKMEIVDTPAAFHDLGAKSVRITDGPRSFLFYVDDGGALVVASWERTQALRTTDRAAADRITFCAGIAAKRLDVLSVRIVSERVAVDYVRAEINPAEPQAAPVEFLRPSRPQRFTVDGFRVSISDTPAGHYTEGAKLLKITSGAHCWQRIIADVRADHLGVFWQDSRGLMVPPEISERARYVAQLARRRMIQSGVVRRCIAVPVRFAFSFLD